MNPLPHPETIREIVLRTFSELLRQVVGRAEVSETVLIRQDCYYGRAYRAGGLLATLVAESGTLCFYQQDGRVLQTLALRVDEQQLAPRWAA